MRVIVTRPAAQAASWVTQLRARQIDAVALPLIGIGAPADAGAVRDAWMSLPKKRLLFFVSPNAAECFFAARLQPDAWPAHVQAASPGPGTSEVLRRCGVPAALIVEPPADAAQFDSESLWSVLQAQRWIDAAVLVIRGDGGRNWLADRLRSSGEDDFVAAYQRVAAPIAGAQRALLRAALAAPEQHLWFFSSSEAIDHLCDACDAGVGSSELPPDWARALALATHPRIAERAQRAGFGRVLASRPTLDAVVACIQSMHRD